MQSVTLDLSRIEPGFSEPGVGSQKVFRQCLNALAHPGTILTLAPDAAIPASMMPATGAIALALLDQDTSVWLSAGLSSPLVVDYLRFHTGCRLTEQPAEADFALVHSALELPALELFCQGSDEFPERSTTVVLQMAALGTDTMWVLSGPGIPRQRRLSVWGSPTLADGGTPVSGTNEFASAFAQEWERNHRRFPRGVDLIFASGHQLCGLPRSTRIGA